MLGLIVPARRREGARLGEPCATGTNVLGSRLIVAGSAIRYQTVGLPYTILAWVRFRKREICDHPFPDMWVDVRITGDRFGLAAVSPALAPIAHVDHLPRTREHPVGDAAVRNHISLLSVRPSELLVEIAHIALRRECPTGTGLWLWGGTAEDCPAPAVWGERGAGQHPGLGVEIGNAHLDNPSS